MGSADETDAGNLHDVIAGASLAIEMLDIGTFDSRDLMRETCVKRLGIEMLHRLSVLPQSQKRRGDRDGRWATSQRSCGQGFNYD